MSEIVMDNDLSEFNPDPTLSASEAVAYLRSRNIKGASQYALRKATYYDKTLEHYVIQNKLCYSERDLMRWVYSKRVR